MNKNLFSILVVALFLFSCSTTDVVNNSFLQKRKYNKGWYANNSVKAGNSSKEESQKDNNQKESEKIEKQVELMTAKFEMVKFDNKSITASLNQNLAIEENYVIITESNKQFVEHKTNSVSHELASAEINNEKVNFSPLQTAAKSNMKSKSATHSASGVNLLLLVIIAFFIPPVAAGIASNWNLGVLLLNILLTLLFYLPGFIHALIVIFR